MFTCWALELCGALGRQKTRLLSKWKQFVEGVRKGVRNGPKSALLSPKGACFGKHRFAYARVLFRYKIASYQGDYMRPFIVVKRQNKFLRSVNFISHRTRRNGNS